LLLLLQVGRNVYRSEWITARQSPSFGAYKAASAFDRVETVIGKPRGSFKLAFVGIPPSVAHLNGFSTVDGYWYLYPIEYKKRFRRVIANEIARDPELETYFDQFGSRAYVFSAELWRKIPEPDRWSFLVTRSKGITRVERLAIDVDALRELGASYVVSSVEIGNAGELSIDLLERISDPAAAMDLYVYALPSDPTAPH
jgi:hypothetical protein